MCRRLTCFTAAFRLKQRRSKSLKVRCSLGLIRGLGYRVQGLGLSKEGLGLGRFAIGFRVGP